MISNGMKVKLSKSLFITRDNGIGTDPNNNKHSEIQLDDQQSGSAVTFPIFEETEGVIVECETYLQYVVVEYYRKESLEQIRIRFNKGAFGAFNS